MTFIGGNAFEGCTSLQEITIPEDITVISDSTFHHCSSLKRITIPECVEEIRGAFEWCYELTDVYYLGTKAKWNEINILTYSEYGHLQTDDSINDIAIIHCLDGDILPTDQ